MIFSPCHVKETVKIQSDISNDMTVTDYCLYLSKFVIHFLIKNVPGACLLLLLLKEEHNTVHSLQKKWLPQIIISETGIYDLFNFSFQ